MVVLFVIYERVTADELVADGVVYIGNAEQTLVFRYLGIEEDMHGQITEFFLDVVGTIVENGFAELMCLFKSEVTQTTEGLTTVPWAFAP